MSDSAQGPGWWLASDGRFYPPELAPGGGQSASPGYQQAPGPGYQAAWSPQGAHPPSSSYQYGSPRRANGAAIASFILSILWIFGIGSLLAIILGVTGRRAIRNSRNMQTGGGLALAGIIIGSLGVAGAFLIISLLGFVATHHSSSYNDGYRYGVQVRQTQGPSADFPDSPCNPSLYGPDSGFDANDNPNEWEIGCTAGFNHG
jgi:hypothetical protein